MIPEQLKTGFQGLRVGALESRMAPEMERLITRHGGIPMVAPSMQEVPLSEHPQALAFGDTLSLWRNRYRGVLDWCRLSNLIRNSRNPAFS